MKRLLKVLPLILFPYVYMIVFAISLTMGNSDFINSEAVSRFMDQFGLILFLGVAIVSNIWSFIIAIVNSVKAGKGKVGSKDATFLLMMIKLLQIPAYIINLVVGLFGLLLSIWGIGLIMWVVVVDIITIFYTGIVGIGTCVSLSKEKKFPNGICVLFGFLNFIYCVDVVIAIVMFIRAKTGKKKIEEVPAETV